MSRNKLIGIVLVIFAYALSSTLSYALFSKSSQKIVSPKTPVTKKTENKLAFDETLPKTEACPLNGILYSKPQKAWWEKHRPLGVMIENHKESRPQSGLSLADIVYEAVAEGGITRFLALYYCQTAEIVGPVRSARTYFIDFASEYGDYPLYVHVGGANQPGPADALGQLSDYGWTGYNDLNQFSIGFPVFWRDYNRIGREVATEHTMYSTTQKLWDYAAKQRNLTNTDEKSSPWDKNFVPYAFVEDEVLTARPTAQSIHLEFWTKNPDYFVNWIYDRATNLYKRINGGVPQLDLNNKVQLTTKNIVVLFMQEQDANDGYIENDHLLYKTRGVGKALIFKNGIEEKGTWRKNKRTAKTLIFDSNGNGVKFNKGVIWFEILPTDGVVEVK